MGNTRTKITYDCNCGYDYGNCEHKNEFLLDYSRSVDLGTIYHKYHGVVKNLGTFTDGGMQALFSILENENVEDWSDDDLENIKY